MISVFIVQFVNIAFVPFIALFWFSFNGSDYIPSKIFTAWMPVVNSVVKSEEGYFCNDFNKKWYVDTGGKYMGFFIL